MQKSPHTPPAHQHKSFHCPFCGVLCRQYWFTTLFLDGNSQEYYHELTFAHCEGCKKRSIWHDGNMIYPDSTGVVPPNADLSSEIQADYHEAASILNKSPRGAAALLRLCVQKLCKQLGESGENINADIASLVKKGLSSKVQQALDVVRVVGNNAVHPGELDLKDNRETAIQLFRLINLIAEKMITEPKEIDEIYTAVVPKAAKEAIKKRDAS